MSNPFEEALVIFIRNTDMERLGKRKGAILRFVQRFYPQAEDGQVFDCNLDQWEEAMSQGTNTPIPVDEHGLMVSYWVSEEHPRYGDTYFRLNSRWGYMDSKINVEKEKSRKFV